MELFDTGFDLGSGLSSVGQTESFGAMDPYATATPDYSTAAPSSVMDSGASGGAWTNLFQGSISKGLDYFMAKDAAVTQAGLLPKTYPQSYIRGNDGRLYQSNGAPVGGYGGQAQQAGGNNTTLLLIAGAVALVLLGRG